MTFVEDCDQIPVECHGSQKHHEAIDVALNWCLIGDILWQKWVAGAVTLVDLTNCYDRMAHSITSLSCQQWGVPPEPLVSMLLTMQSMAFFLRMAHGDSTDSYGGMVDNPNDPSSPHPFQGICQGNGGRLAASLRISAPCVQLLHQRGHITSFQHALSERTLDIVGLIYVDDTDLVEIAHTPQETMAIVGPHMQDKTSCWNGGTRATGGAQKIDKCSWTPVEFVWDATGKWYCCTDIPSSIELLDEDGIIRTIDKLAPSDALTVMGVEQSLDGNMVVQVLVLEEKAMALGNCIKEGYLHRHLVWQSFWTMIWPSLRYPLPATTLDEDQLEFITKQLYKMMLLVGGMN